MWGRIKVTGANDITVAFPTSFTTIPSVVISPISKENNEVVDYGYNPKIQSISTSNFIINTEVLHHQINESNIAVNWFAIGK